MDRPRPADGQLVSAHIRPITPGFFKTLGIPHVAGRDFSDADTVESMPVAIVSQTLVREQYGSDDPLGRRIRANFDHTNGRSDMEWTVIGVVGDIKSSLDGGATADDLRAETQSTGAACRFFVRTAQEPTSLAPGVMSLIQGMEAEAPVDVRTLDDVVGGTIRGRARSRCWSACSRSWPSRSRRSACSA